MVLKSLRFCAVAMSIVALTTGCSYLFGPKPDDAKPFAKKNDVAGIKDVPKTLKAWLQDGHGDIGAAIDTVVRALDEFSRHVVGKTKDVYTEKELAEFISEYIIAPDSPNAGDVNTWTEQILTFKQIIFGGTNDLITKDEIARLKSLLLREKPLLVNLSPQIRTVLFANPTATVADVTEARDGLTQVLELVAQEFEKAEPGRPEFGFRDLLNSAHRLGFENDGVASWLPVAESMKVLILSGDPDMLRAREWAPMIRTIAEAWGLTLRARYNLSGNPEMLGRDFPMFEQSVREVVGILDRSVQAHQGEIPEDVFENLIDAVAAKQMLPSVNGHFMTAPTLKALLPTIFGKLLYGRWNKDWDHQSQHFGTAQLARVKMITDDWLAGQKLINDSMVGRKALSVTDFGKALAKTQVLRKNFVDDVTYSRAQIAQKQMLIFMSKGRPTIHDSAGRLIVVTRNELPQIQKSDLDFINETRVVMEAVLTGWTHDPLNAQGIVGLTSDEVQEAYLDLRDLGRDLNFIDVRSNQAGTRTFMENAIFMSSSDGNPYMGLHESVEWFNFVLSGSQIADQFYKDMEGPCGVAKLDVLHNQKLEPNCFRREFLRNWPRYMPNLPHLVQWAAQDGTGERSRELLTGLENAGRNRGASQDLVDSSEFRSMIPVAHYLESMFARHDVNQNGVLDSDEIWKAFPLLAPFIKKMANGKADGEEMQKTILSYILEFGVVPQTDTMGIIKLGGWYLIHGLFEQSADRAKVLQVIGSFPAGNKQTRNNNIKDYYNSNKDSLRALLTAREPNNAAKLTDLFQCLPDASAIIGADLAQNADKLAPRSSDVGDDAFITEMKSIIDADSRLETYCLPF